MMMIMMIVIIIRMIMIIDRSITVWRRPCLSLNQTNSKLGNHDFTVPLCMGASYAPLSAVGGSQPLLHTGARWWQYHSGIAERPLRPLCAPAGPSVALPSPHPGGGAAAFNRTLSSRNKTLVPSLSMMPRQLHCSAAHSIIHLSSGVHSR